MSVNWKNQWILRVYLFTRRRIITGGLCLLTSTKSSNPTAQSTRLLNLLMSVHKYQLQDLFCPQQNKASTETRQPDDWPECSQREIYDAICKRIRRLFDPTLSKRSDDGSDFISLRLFQFIVRHQTFIGIRVWILVYGRNESFEYLFFLC